MVDLTRVRQKTVKTFIQFLSTSVIKIYFQKCLNEVIELIFIVIKSHWNSRSRYTLAIVQNSGDEIFIGVSFSQGNDFSH